MSHKVITFLYSPVSEMHDCTWRLAILEPGFLIESDEVVWVEVPTPNLPKGCFMAEACPAGLKLGLELGLPFDATLLLGTVVPDMGLLEALTIAIEEAPCSKD